MAGSTFVCYTFIEVERKDMHKKNGARQRAKQHLLKARRLVAQTSGVPRREKEIIALVRQTREQLWNSKLASRS